MAHSPKHYTEMGRLVARAGILGCDEPTAEYRAMLLEGHGVIGTRLKHLHAEGLALDGVPGSLGRGGSTLIQVDDEIELSAQADALSRRWRCQKAPSD